MSRKNNRPSYKKKSFESDGSSSDTFASIYGSMLMRPVWMDLSAKQQVLYLYCKFQHYGEKKKPVPGDDQTFTMNKTKWCNLYKLYTEGNSSAFYKDRDALIMHGFITCVEDGSTTRTKNIYRFSDKWQLYGTPEFKIEPYEMPRSLSKKLLQEHNNQPQ